MLNENSTQLSFRNSRLSEETMNTNNANNLNTNNTLIRQLSKARAELRPVVHSYNHQNHQQQKQSKNMSNLRDVLRAVHESEPKVRGHNAQLRNSLVDLLKLTDKTNQNKPKVITNKLEEDLEESLRLLKRRKENESYDDADRSSVINEEESANSDEASLTSSSSSSILNESSGEVFKPNESLKMASLIAKMGEGRKTRRPRLSELRVRMKPSICESPEPPFLSTYSSSSSSSSSASPSASSNSPISTSEEHNNSSSNPHNNHNQTYWNYDELNELRVKFISLLNNSSRIGEETTQSPSINSVGQSEFKKRPSEKSVSKLDSTGSEQLSDLSSASRVSAMPPAAPQSLQPISPNELLKIESFYRSFGTSLYLANTSACLYTMNNLQPRQTTADPKSARNSMIYSAQMPASMMRSAEIDPQILHHFMSHTKPQSLVSVYHRGVPLWLFNSGTNPRRAARQLKFTLAEKGTGFILWQDRIDANSDLKIYAQRKSDQKIINYGSFIENEPQTNRNELISDLFASMLITFRASDRKTSVFIKFDLTTETAKFYDYFHNLNQRINIEIKHRTKSLPPGIGNQFNTRVFANNAGNNVVRRSKVDFAEAKNNYKRQSCYVPNLKYRRISKHDISSPCDMRHIININQKDRDLYYTLSKLLPTSTNASICSERKSPSQSTTDNNNSSSLIFSTSSVVRDSDEKKFSSIKTYMQAQSCSIPSSSYSSFSSISTASATSPQNLNQCVKVYPNRLSNSNANSSMNKSLLSRNVSVK